MQRYTHECINSHFCYCYLSIKRLINCKDVCCKNVNINL